MGKRYVLASRGLEKVIRGASWQCAKGYLEGKNLRLRVSWDHGWVYFLGPMGTMRDLWDRYDLVPCDGSQEEALQKAYRQFFLDHLLSEEWWETLIILPEEKAGAFLMDYDELLKAITAWEVREYCLDLDEEFETRLWFHENRGKRKAA